MHMKIAMLSSVTKHDVKSIDTLRIATKLDVEAIVQLVNMAYRPDPDLSGWTHEADLVSGNRTNTDQVIAIMAKPDSEIIVGLQNTAIVACVHVEKDGSNCYIGMLAVNPSAQEAGIGKQMLAYAENYAVSMMEAKKFTMLVVSARSELTSFYLRRGYRKTGALLDYPLSAGAGTPKCAGLKVEVLEKWPSLAEKTNVVLSR